MNDTQPLSLAHPLESLLRLLAAAAPAPWFPGEGWRETGLAREQLDDVLQDLWLEGLIQPAGQVVGRGPGIRLTALGEQTLREPAMLDRLRTGQPLVPGDPGAEVRHRLRYPPRAWITPVLLAANVLMFGYGPGWPPSPVRRGSSPSWAGGCCPRRWWRGWRSRGCCTRTAACRPPT